MDYGRLRGRNRFGQFGISEKDVFDPEGKKLKSTDIGLYPKLTSLFKRGFGLKYVAKPMDSDAEPKKRHIETIKNQFASATYDHFVRATTIEVDRLKTFEDFVCMDYSPEISSALDIFADECLTKNEEGQILTINTENTRVKLILENLFIDILDVEHNMWHWTRNMCKYGNHYLLLDVQPDRGIVGFLPLPIKEIRRIEAYDGNVNSVKFVWDTQTLEFDNWQIAHFRMLDKMDKYPYGTSCLESARLIWKSLSIAEDAMLIYRTTRAPERRVFYIDVGNIDPGDVKSYIQEMKDQVKRVPQIDQSSGNINKKYNTMAIDEDFFIPVRGDKSSRVESLPGASNLDEIADIEYLQNKLFAALKVPKAYLTFEEQINAKCLTLDTKIKLLDGRNLTLNDVILEYESGNNNYTYTINEDGKIVPGKIIWAGKTKFDKIAKITLDNGEIIKCSYDHPFMTRSGDYIQAQNLNVGQSLMPLYSEITDTNIEKFKNKKLNGYEVIYCPYEEEWRYTHQIIAESFGHKINGGKVIHHKDFNKLNNNPDNLDCSMSIKEHIKYHSENINLGMNSPDNLLKRLQNEKWKKSVKLAGRKGGLKSKEKLVNWIKQNGAWNKGLTKEAGDEGLRPIKYDLIKITCEKCGDIFEHTSAPSHNRKFCSRSCANSYNMTIIRKNEKENGKKRLNHTIKSVELTSEYIQMGDITIDVAPNFALSSGVFVHNSTLSTEDFRFARTINRIQQAAIATLTNIAITHLWSLGFREKEHLTGFEIELTNPSIQSELEKMELLNEKTTLFTSIWNESSLSPVSYVWAMENIFGFSEDEIKSILNQQFLEGKIKLQIEKAAGTGMEAGVPGMEMQADFEGGEGMPEAPPAEGGGDIAKVELAKETIEKLIESAKRVRELNDKKKKREINNEKRMITNSLTYDGTIRMLESIDEKLLGKIENKINILFDGESNVNDNDISK